MVQLSNPYMTTGKTIAWTIQTFTFVSRVMSLVINTLSRFVIAFLPRSKCLLISWRSSPPTPRQPLLSLCSSRLAFSKTHVIWWDGISNVSRATLWSWFLCTGWNVLGGQGIAVSTRTVPFHCWGAGVNSLSSQCLIDIWIVSSFWQLGKKRL